MSRFKKILIRIFIILFDIVVYLFLGLQLMHYDDFYEESKGEYWSYVSMTQSEKLASIGINIWNLVNLIAIGYIFYRIISGIIKTHSSKV